MGRASRGPPPSIAGRSGNSGATPAEVDISPRSVPQIGNADLLAAGLRYHQELIRLLESERMGALPEQRKGQCKNSTNLEAAGGLMSDRLEFDIVCPNNHNQTLTFSHGEFEEALKSGALVFHCNTCDTDWTPTSDEIAGVRKQFSEEP